MGRDRRPAQPFSPEFSLKAGESVEASGKAVVSIFSGGDVQRVKQRCRPSPWNRLWVGELDGWQGFYCRQLVVVE